MVFAYAFKLMDDIEERTMKLTEKEFANFFMYTPPKTAQKALAYSEFYVEGIRFIRVPMTT